MAYNAIKRRKKIMEYQILKALEFARKKHRGQLRKITGEPYFNHILATVRVLRQYDAALNVQIAGALHDTLEDTETTLAEIVSNFGLRVAYMVDVVTEKKELNYADRKALQVLRIKNSDINTQILKCADVIANLRDTYKNMRTVPHFWDKFNADKDTIMKKDYEMLNAFTLLKDTEILKEAIALYNKIYYPDLPKTHLTNR